jgi:multidrug resistance efflux pump
MAMASENQHSGNGNSIGSPARKLTLKRAIRMVVGIGMLSIAGTLGFAWLRTPALWTITSTQAVVNAPIRILHAPIEGIVTTQPPAVGMSVVADSPLVTIENPLVDNSHLEELKTEATALTERVTALQAQQEALASLKESLLASARKHHEAVVRRLQRRVEEARSAAAAADAFRKQRDYKKEQTAKLAGGNAVSQLEMITTQLAQEVAVNKATLANFTLQRLTEELEAVRAGSPGWLGDGHNDVPYSQQRAHEIALHQQEIATKIREHSARCAQVQKQVHIEQERLNRQARFVLTAPSAGIVWRQPVTAGACITRQTELLELLDGSAIFVDALVNEKYFGDIHPGDPVIVKLIGSHAEVPGRVKAVLGRVAPADYHFLAAEISRPNSHEIHVVVGFADDSATADYFYSQHIGQPVEVRFANNVGVLRRLWDLVSP